MIGRSKWLWVALASCSLAACGPSPTGSGGGTAGDAGSGRGGAAAGGTGGGGGGAAGVTGAAGAGPGGAGGGGASGAGTGGTSAGGAGTGGNGGAAGGSSVAGRGGASGASAAGGRAGSGAAGAAGGNAGTAGAGGGTAGAGGAPSGFVCNQVTGFTLTSEWYLAGFEKGVVDARWQIKFREHGYITEWANPSSAFWGDDAANGAPISSPCAQGSDSPDHVVLNVLSWTITAEAEWTTDITAAVNNLKAKYPNLKRIDLMTVIRGPGNMLCPTAPAAGETIVMPPELDAAMAAVAAQFPGFVFVAPKFEAPSCAAFSGGGPHLTSAGNMAIAPTLAAYFATTQ
jgi:hypothetical protein